MRDLMFGFEGISLKKPYQGTDKAFFVFNMRLSIPFPILKIILFFDRKEDKATRCGIITM